MRPPIGFVYHHSQGSLLPAPHIVHVYIDALGRKWGWVTPSGFMDALRANRGWKL